MKYKLTHTLFRSQFLLRARSSEMPQVQLTCCSHLLLQFHINFSPDRNSQVEKNPTLQASLSSKQSLKGLNHFSCWPCFDNHHFAKHFPLLWLQCWLHSPFNPAHTRDGTYSCALHFLRRNFCETIYDLSEFTLLHLCLHQVSVQQLH